MAVICDARSRDGQICANLTDTCGDAVQKDRDDSVAGEEESRSA